MERGSELEEKRGAWQAWHAGAGPVRIGVSGCLLGEAVRYDGGHRRDAFLVDVLGPFVEWVSVCPEVELGMGVPRPTVQLVDDGEELRMISSSSGEDFTARMEAFARARVEDLRARELDGYVLKRNSPSCGPQRVEVHALDGSVRNEGTGLFARALLRALPHLPVEDEGRLAEAAVRDGFVERVFCRQRWRALLAGERTRARLAGFARAHELQLRAHDEAGWRRLEELLEDGQGGGEELYRRFERAFFTALGRPATLQGHARALRSALGTLRAHLAAAEHDRLAAAIEDHARGRLPLVVPVTLLRSQIEEHGVAELLGQLYLDPHPAERLLRNHA